ncbi:MAG: PQQ-dependent dehydrogenase, methanol/ethanol family, partial [Pseudomonadota bacterium]|nr:PQQ-dependent dehydrogenase, methanol/ethanol family [Pseudomonadota bacterium]
IVVDGKVITGISGGEFGIVGKVYAYDAKSGKQLWVRPTVEGHMGYLWKDGKKTENGISGGAPGKTWPADLWKTGGAATWLGGTYDSDTGLLFFGTGNPAPWNSHLRPGDNYFSSSRLAIDPNTGKIVWHFQTTPHDGWDFDGVNELISFDYQENGKTVKAAATADRNGFFYVLNRENGDFIRGFPFVDKLNWAKGLDEKGRPIYVDENRPGSPAQSADGKQGAQVVARPAFLGGKNWMPMAYSKDTELFYVPSNEWEMDIWNEPTSYKKGAAYLGAGFTIKSVNEDFIGVLKAIDPKTGKTVWRYNNFSPLWGGVLTTGGGLVWTGNPEGYLMAFDDKTGEMVYKFQTGSGIVGSPVTWEMDGEQYISVLSGWGGAVPLWGGEVAKRVKHFNQGGTVWTFKLPKRYQQVAKN